MVTKIAVFATLQIFVVCLASSKKLSKNLDRSYHSNLLGAFEVCLELPIDAFLCDAFKRDAF